MRLPATMALVASLALPVAARAQDSPPHASKYQNVAWYTVDQTAFKPGKMEDAMGIIRKYYLPAAKAAGVPGPVMILEDHTGPWDLTLVWAMKDGPSDMAWKESPDDVAWYKAFVKVAGGEAKAKELQQRFESDVARGTSYVALQENALTGGGK